MNYFHRLLFIVIFLTGCLPVLSQTVMVLKIREEIDPRMSRYVELGLEEATRQKADYILVDMDTYGGAVQDADKIRTLLGDYPKPVWVYINKNAASAGALISIACDSIYMDSGANIGAATVVDGSGKPAPDKYQAYMRAMMRTTAEKSKRDPAIAEGMVGKAVGRDSITVGNVIAFTTSEAIKNGFCEGERHSVQEILNQNHLGKATVIHYELNTTNTIINFFLNPFLRGLLLLLIIGGIYFEMQSPGIGFPLAAAVVGVILYFLPSYLNGLAANWEIALFFVGVALLVTELVIIPGFGITGFTGITLIVASLILVVLNNNNFDFTLVPEDEIIQSVSMVLIGICGGIAAVLIGGNQFMKSAYFKRVALQKEFRSSEGYTSNFNTADYSGRTGISYTVLRPSGKIIIDGELHDAYTRGEYIEANTPVIVIDHLSSSLKVKEFHAE